MLKFVTFAVVVAVVAAQGRPGLESLFGNAEPEMYDQEEVERMARDVVEGDPSEICDNEEEFYKWYPPLPCRVENSTYSTLAERQCPEDGQCNVGPVDSNLNTTAVRIFFCSRPGKYMLYQACRIRNVETGEEREASQCASYDGRPVTCSVGPFAVLSNNTDYMVTYCSTTMTDNLKAIAARGVVSQACRIENDDGDDLVRRRCPMGFRCTKGPMEGELNEREVKAYLCEEHEEQQDDMDIIENWDKSLADTVHFLVVEKQVDPFVILMIMRNLTDHGMEISGKMLLYKVHEHKQMQGEEGEGEREEDDEEEKDDENDAMKIMHDLHHLSLLSMQAKIHEMTGEDDDSNPMAQLLKLMLMTQQNEEGMGGHMDELLKGMMGKKQEQEEEEDGHDLEDLIKMMMGKKAEEDEGKDMEDLIKALMGMQQEKKMSKADQVKSVFMKVKFVKAVLEKVTEVMEGEGDDEAKMVKVMYFVHQLVEENEDIMANVPAPMKVMKVLKAVHIVKNNFEGAEEEEDEDVKWMLVIVKKLQAQKAEEEEEDQHDLLKLMMMLKGKKEMSEAEQLNRSLMRMNFVTKLFEKLEKIDDDEDEEIKMAKVLHAVHEMVEAYGEVMDGDDDIKKVMKVMKAIHIIKSNGEGAEEEEDEDVKWMLLAAKRIMERAEAEEEGEEGQLREQMKKIAFVKALGEKVMEIEESTDDEGARLAMLLEAVHGMVEEKGDIIKGKDGLAKVFKVMKAVHIIKNNFEGAEEVEDEDVKWMLAIAKVLKEKMMAEEMERNPLMALMKMLLGEKEEEEEDRNPLVMLMKMLQGKREDDEEERDPMRMLMKMLQGKREEDEKERDPMRMLMKMLQGKREEDEEERDPMRMLMKMLQGKREEDEEDRNPLMALMKMMHGKMEDDDEEEGREGVLKEILSHLKELSEKDQEADREGMQMLMFVKALMGGEGGENLQEVMHYLQHLHMVKAEHEMREKYAEKSKQMEAESKAQELLQYMHQTYLQRQMGGNFGPPMMGRW